MKLTIQSSKFKIILVAMLLLSGAGAFGVFSPAPASRAAQFGGRILYTHANQIWVWQDGNSRRLSVAGRVRPDFATDPEELETQPAWSADGSRFAYIRYGDSYADLVVAAADGRNVVRLTNNFDPNNTPGTDGYVKNTNWAFAPSWRPDGNRIAFLSDRSSDPLAVWSTASTPDAESFVRLSPAAMTERGLEHPAWSPDNTSILATCYVNNKGEIWRFDLEKEEWQPLIKGDEADYDAAWSPDGKYIAYAAKVGGKTSIWVARADGSGATRLINDDKQYRNPTWSPDGNALAFLRQEQRGFNLYAASIEINGTQVKLGSPQQLTNDNQTSGTGGLSWGRLALDVGYFTASLRSCDAHTWTA